MAVTVTISETSGGAVVSDALSGGGTGWDIGAVVNGGFTGLVAPLSANTGSNDLYIFHDAVTDPLTNLSVYLEQYSQAYGGVATAAQDFARLQTLAEATGSNKNNADGLTQGFWIDMNWDALVPNQFDYANFGPVADTIVTGAGGGAVRVMRRTDGGNITDPGSELSDRITVLASAMFLDPLTVPSGPLDGTIGKAADAVLGDRCKIKHRLYLEEAETTSGIIQWDETFAFTYTA